MNCQTEGNYIIDDMSHKLSRSNRHIFFSQNLGGGGVKKWVDYNQTSEKWLEILILLWKDENYHLVKFLT